MLIDRITGFWPPDRYYAELKRCPKCGRRTDIVLSPDGGLYLWICSGRKKPATIFCGKKWKPCSHVCHMESVADYDAHVRGVSRLVDHRTGKAPPVDPDVDLRPELEPAGTLADDAPPPQEYEGPPLDDE